MVVLAAKRQRIRLPVGTVLPLIPRIRRPQRFAFVTNPADLDPDEVRSHEQVAPASARNARPCIQASWFAGIKHGQCTAGIQVDALWKLAFGAQLQEPRRWCTRDRWETVLRHSYAVSCRDSPSARRVAACR